MVLDIGIQFCSIAAPQFKVCPPYWKSYLDQCYELVLLTKSWYDAQADCHMKGGALSSPNDQAHQDFVMSLLQAGGR